MSGTGRLIFYVAGIYLCFLTWGITQERVSTTRYGDAKFSSWIFLNVVQAAIASLVALIYARIKREKIDELNRQMFWNYSGLSFFHCLASPFGYAALKHIDYPTVILGKSCKLIPVMLMNFLMYRKIYPLRKYLVVILITAGVSLFMILQPTKGKDAIVSSLYGISLLMVNLLIDGATNSTQG